SLAVTFAIELGVLSVILLIAGNMVLPWLPVVVVLAALFAMGTLGVGLVLAAANVYFRDVKHFVGIALQALFYSAPIVSPMTLVLGHRAVLGVSVPVRFVYRLTPLVRFVESFRNVLYDLRFPSFVTCVYVVGWSFGMLVLGRFVFGRLEPRLAEEV